MRRLTLLTVLVLTVLSTPVFAEWTKVGKNVDGTTFYVDFDRIRKHGGYVYYWILWDLLKPTEYGHLSVKRYQQGVCRMLYMMFLDSDKITARFEFSECKATSACLYYRTLFWGGYDSRY